MPVLHLDNVSDELFQSIADLAAAHRLSVIDEAVLLLKRAVTSKQSALTGSDRSDVPAILAQIQRNQMVLPAGTRDSTELLREDRMR